MQWRGGHFASAICAPLASDGAICSRPFCSRCLPTHLREFGLQLRHALRRHGAQSLDEIRQLVALDAHRERGDVQHPFHLHVDPWHDEDRDAAVYDRLLDVSPPVGTKERGTAEGASGFESARRAGR